MTFEELAKQILSEYACKMKALCLQKKEFTNALICKYGPKDGQPTEPAATNKHEVEYIDSMDSKMLKLKFDTNEMLRRAQFKHNWKRGDVAIRQRVLDPDIRAISELKTKYFLDRALTDQIIYGRGGAPLEFGDAMEMTVKAFGKKRDSTSRSASAGTDDSDGEVINLPAGG
jgi:hypothetical protein